MMKAWRKKNNVDISGMLIETLVMNFMPDWEHKDKSFFYYDFMTRDFLKYLSEQDKEQKYWLAKGSGQYVYRIGSFESKAKTSHNDAIEAIGYEEKYPSSAKTSWQKIFGSFYEG